MAWVIMLPSCSMESDEKGQTSINPTNTCPYIDGTSETLRVTGVLEAGPKHGLAFGCCKLKALEGWYSVVFDRSFRDLHCCTYAQNIVYTPKYGMEASW